MLNERRDFALKFFLSKQLSRMEELLRFVPQEEKQNLIQTPSFPIDENKISHLPLESIHWSWFIPVLKEYPTQEQRLLFNVLHQNTQKHLREEIKLKPLSIKITRSLFSFLRDILWQQLSEEKEILPLYFLPPSPLNSLLDIEKTKLTELINLLALHDLSVSLRQIVETKILKKIYSFLQESEKQFLKAMAGHKEPYPTTRLDLENWDGSERSFRLMIHKRGLSHLGAALSGQHPDLIWYLCHHLDIGRGQALMKLCQSRPIPGLSEPIIEQIKKLFEQPETNS